MMNTSRIYYVVVVIFILSACATQPLSIKPGLTIETLGLCLDFNEHVEAEEKLLYLNATNELVKMHNQAAKLPRLATCNKSQVHTLNIKVQNTQFVDPDEQAFYVLLSVAGIAYPLSGGKIGFAWLGFNTSNLEVTVSETLSDAVKPVYTQIYSSPYFLSATAVRFKHMERFKIFIADLVKEIESKVAQNAVIKGRNLSWRRRVNI